MEIIEIPESFVNFCDTSTDEPCSETDAGCVESVGACYPMVALDELYFQVLLSDFTGNEVDLILGGQITFVLTIARTCDDCEVDTFVGYFHAEPWKTTGTDANDFIVLSMDTWSDVGPFTALSEADCFVLCLWKQYNGEFTKLGCSPCFIKYSDECDTTVIEYHQNETSMGFYNNGNVFYDTYFNAIRLPFRLHQPQPKTKKNVYQLSNGNFIKNSAAKSMEWKGETDMMSEKWHRKLDISLDHDVIKLTNINSGFTSAFFMSESDDNYKIDWQEFLDYPHAKAEFVLKQMPYNEFNNNCNLTPLNPLTNVNALLADSYNLLSWD